MLELSNESILIYSSPIFNGRLEEGDHRHQVDFLRVPLSS